MQPCTGTTTQPSTKVNGDTTEAVVVAHGEVIAQERLHLFFSWFSVASLAHGVPMNQIESVPRSILFSEIMQN